VPRPLESARLLIVDDEPANVQLLERILKKGGYTNIESVNDARRVLAVFSNFQPDLVLLDLLMPHMDGFMVMEQLKRRFEPGTINPILVLTADARKETREKALSSGAKDFLVKPLDATEVLLRVRNLVETRFLHQTVLEQNRELEARVQARTRELEEAYMDTVERLARAAGYRDDATGRQTRRLGETAALLALALGLPEDQVQLIRQAAPLHDIGKIGIPDKILLKPTRLTPDEYDTMRSHTTIGVNLLSGSKSPLMQLAEEIALYHHEHWDGTGYMSLQGEDIPMSARIVAVADAFESITSTRPFRPAGSVEDALAEIEAQSGKQFDPQVVGAFLRLYGARSSSHSETADLSASSQMRPAWEGGRGPVEERPTPPRPPSRPDPAPGSRGPRGPSGPAY
jgi:putative two-component system response regulator